MLLPVLLGFRGTSANKIGWRLEHKNTRRKMNSFPELDKRVLRPKGTLSSLAVPALAHCQKLFFDDTEQQKKKLEDELSSRKAFEAYARTAGRRWTGMPQLLLFGGRVLSSLISIMMRSRISCAE